MKICSNCGKECNDDIRFCMYCGNPFPMADDAVTPDNSAEAGYSGQQYSGQQQDNQQYQYQQYGASNGGNQYQQYGAQQNQQYQQYGGTQYGQQQYYQPPEKKPVNGFAIAALVLGIVGILPPFYFFVIQILAIIFGALGINKAKKGAGGRGMAIAGLVLGIIALVIILIVIIWAAVVVSSIGGLGVLINGLY